MKTETIYKVLKDYLTSENINPKMIKEWETTPLSKPSSGGIGDLINLCKHLELDIMQQNNKTNGKKDIAKSMQFIIKNAKKVQPKEFFKGAFIQNGKQYVCDDYQAICIDEPIELEMSKLQERAPDMRKVFDPSRQNPDELELPTIAELKTFIATNKRPKERTLYNFGDGKPQVDAKYLLNILKGFTDVICYSNGTTRPLYFKGNEGEAILCPVRK